MHPDFGGKWRVRGGEVSLNTRLPLPILATCEIKSESEDVVLISSICDNEFTYENLNIRI